MDVGLTLCKLSEFVVIYVNLGQNYEVQKMSGKNFGVGKTLGIWKLKFGEHPDKGQVINLFHSPALRFSFIINIPSYWSISRSRAG